MSAASRSKNAGAKPRKIATDTAVRRSQLQLSISNDSKLVRVPRKLMEQSIRLCMRQHRILQASVSIVLISDAAMRKMNKKFLQHDYATDIITFPLEEDLVDGELYISVDTAARQAIEFGVSLHNELLRLVVHGVLHLIGFDDATPALRAAMHEQENIILGQL